MPVTTEKEQTTKTTNWADSDDEEETGPTVTIDENGLKTITEIKTNEKGQKVRVTKKFRVYTKIVRKNKNVEARKKWKKFGECAGAPPGTETGITSESLDEFELVLGGPQQKEEAKEVSSVPATNVCRVCGKVGDHWTLKCPFKPADKADGTAEEEVKKGDTYKAPHLRAGAAGRSPSMGSSSSGPQREDLATVRVTNLSEDTKEADLQELFRPFGPISRIYLAKDKENNTSRGFAFVSFHRKEDAARAIDKLSGYGYDHLILHLEWAKPSK